VKVVHPFRTSGTGYGLERNILCTLPGLVRQGVEAIALAITEQRSGPVSEAFAAQLEQAGVRLITVEARGRLPLKLARRLSEVFETEKPDIIHSHDYKSDLAMLLAKTAGAVRMTTIHGWCSRNTKERFYEWLNVQCCKRMDAVVVFCQDYKRRLTRRGVPERLVHAVPVGLDPAVLPREGIDFRKQWGIADDAVVVAQLGRLSKEKHPEVFVQVARNLSQRFPEARFVLVGDGDMREELRQQAESPGGTDAIIFAGYVRAMADVLEAIDIAVNCSSTEAIPRTVLEAGSAGRPVVATAVGGVPDAVQDGVTGILCPPGDVEAIEAGIARLIENAELRQTMGAAARERVERVFGVAACSQRLLDLYRSLTARKELGDK